MTQLGLLIVFSEPPAAFEEELNAWYDTDHIPERLAIPGFLSCNRYVSAQRPRRYLALYELTNAGVLDTEAYKAFAGERFTPWTKRVVARARFDRYEATQVQPGNIRQERASRLLVMRFSETDAQSALDIGPLVRAMFGGKNGIPQPRIYSATSDGKPSCFVFVDGHGGLESHLDVIALGKHASKLDLVESFVPY